MEEGRKIGEEGKRGKIGSYFGQQELSEADRQLSPGKCEVLSREFLQIKH